MIKEMIKKILLREKYDSVTYSKFLRKKGVNVGDNVLFIKPKSITVDLTRPFMISIGSNSVIGANVNILSHDFSWGVIKSITGEIMGNCKSVVIEESVFIGWNVMILGGVTIGHHSIIGAGSVVTKSIPSNEVWAGNPARKICTVLEYYQKNKNQALNQAYSLYEYYFNRYNESPKKELFFEFFYLFEKCSTDKEKNNWYRDQLYKMGTYDKTIAFYQDKEPQFKSYEEFLIYCKDRYNSKN